MQAADASCRSPLPALRWCSQDKLFRHSRGNGCFRWNDGERAAHYRARTEWTEWSARLSWCAVVVITEEGRVGNSTAGDARAMPVMTWRRPPAPLPGVATDHAAADPLQARSVVARSRTDRWMRDEGKGLWGHGEVVIGYWLLVTKGGALKFCARRTYAVGCLRRCWASCPAR